jgi:uncharacterized repeat protein (TIGR02543 family)
MRKIIGICAFLFFLFALAACTGTETITINFNTNGGNVISEIEIDAATTTIDLPDPVKEGFQFGGWYFDVDLEVPFSISGLLTNQNPTLYAKWTTDEIESLTITFQSNGGSAVAPISFSPGATITIPQNPTKAGYNFKGWYVDQSLTNLFSLTNIPTNNITLYAKWAEIITITFNSNGGSAVASYNHEAGTVINAPTQPVKSLHSFGGWYSDQALTTLYTFTTMPTQDITLYAKWNPVTTINFNSNGGSSVTIYIHDVGTAISAPTAPTKTGYTFSGWYSDQALLTAYTFTTMPAQDITLFAKWSINSYTLTFNSNGGSAVTALVGDFQTSISAPTTPTKAGYTFGGWYSDQALTTLYAFATMPAQNMTLYAKWEPVIYTMSFETNGGGIIDDIKLGYQETIPAITGLNKEGYTFEGWYTDQMLSIAYTIDKMPLNGMKLYAKWEPISYSITYEEVGGSLITDENHPYQENIVEPAVPTKTDFIFDGWYLDNLYENRFVFDKMPSENLTLYAKWIDATDPTSIAVLTNQAENTFVSISGIVYAENASLYPGFYIYDETGYVYIDVMHTTVAINDLVSLDGNLAFDGDVAYITTVTNLLVNSSNQTEKTPKPLSLAEVDMLNVPSKYIINDLYEAEGILIKEDEQFSIIDISVFEGITIYGPSFLNDRIIELDALVLDRVEFTYVLVYKDDEYQISIVDIEANTLSEVEKVTIIKDLLIEYAVEPYYQEGSLFELPLGDPLGFVSLEYEAIGDNAIYYDMATHTFLDIDQETVIIFEITLTSIVNPLITETFNINVIVKPFIVDTVLDLLEGQTDSYYKLDVIVVSTSDSGIIMLKDDTGIVLAYSNNQLQIGDRIIIRAKRQLEGDQVILSFENDGLEILDMISHENELGLIAQPMTLQELLALDETDPTIYGNYVELRGYLLIDEFGYHYIIKLVDGLDEVNVEPYTYQGFEKIMGFTYLEVYVKGFVTQDEDNLTIYYEGIRDDIEIPEYTDQELVDTVKQTLIYMFENKEFETLDEFILYPYHPVLGTDVTWELSTLTEQYYDFENQCFTYSLGDIDIEITATIQEGSATASYTINTVLHAIELTPISDLIESFPYNDYYIHGFITYWHPDYSYISDENGLMILVDEHLEGVRKGDEVFLNVTLNTYYSGVVYLESTYNEENLIVDILSHDNEVLYTAVSYDMKVLYESDLSDPNLYARWIVVEGYIEEKNSEEYYLETIDGSLKIYTPDDMTMYELSLHEGELVSLTAVLHNYEIFEEVLVVNYIGFEGHIEPVQYSDLEKVTLTKQYIQENYQTPIYGNSNFDFYLANDLYNGGSLDITVLTDNNNAISLNTDYIYSVDEYSEAYLEVTVTYGVESETFYITMTILPEDPVVISSIADAILDNINVFTIRGVVVGVSDTIGSGYIFLVEDATGFIRVKLSYEMFNEYYDYGIYGYIGDTLDITGTTYNDIGYNQMDAQLINPYHRNEMVDKTFVPKTVLEINSLDDSDYTIYGQAVNIIGVIEKEEGLNADHYYISDGANRVLLSTKDIYWSQISEYLGYQVSLNGFVFGSNPIFDNEGLTILTNRYVYGSTPSVALNGYSDEQIVDYILDGVYADFYEYDNLYQPQDSVILPSISLPFELEYQNAELTYYILQGSEYLISYGYYYETQYATEDQKIILQAQVTLNSITKTIDLEFDLNGYEYSTLSDLFAIEEGTSEIALEATVLYQDFGYYYFLIEDKVYYLEYYSYDWIETGYEVTIIGKKRVIDGTADYTYEIMFIQDDYSGVEPIPQVITLETLYTNDYESNPYQESQLSVFGKVGYDHYLDMYTLSDEGHMVYIRTNKHWDNYLDEYVDFYIYLDAYLPLGKYVRGDYMVIDSGSSFDEISVAELSSQDSVDEIIILANQYLGDYQITSGQYLDFPSADPYYGTTIDYELVDPNDYIYVDLDNGLSNIVSAVTEIDVLVTVTSLDGLISDQTTITITISPLYDISIREAYRADEDEYIQTIGVITSITYDSGEYDMLIIDDGFDEIMVEVSEYSVFDYDSLDINIGDEIRVIGTLYTDNDISYIIDPSSVIEVVTLDKGLSKTSETYSFEDIMDIDYLSLDHILTYVNVSGLLLWDGTNYVIQNSAYYVSDFEGTHFYDIGIILDSGVINLTLNNAIDNIVEVEGYISLDYIETYFDWYITPTNIVTNIPE